MEPPPLLTLSQARACVASAGGVTPVFAYSERALLAQAALALGFPHAFGLTVRFAMKALPTAAVLRLLLARGLQLDAGSAHEALRAVAAGAPADAVCISSQELPADDGELAALLLRGVRVNACSLLQLERIARALDAAGAPAGAAARDVGLRFNPGVGSGGTAYKTNVGGPHSSFGLWHARAAEALALAAARGLRIVRLHTHVGSGGDPAVWQRACALTLALARRFPDVHTLNLGGGFRVARAAGEPHTDLQAVGAPVRALLEAFAAEAPSAFVDGTAENSAGGGGNGGAEPGGSGGGGRRLHLEIEPGTFLVAGAGALVCAVGDVVETPRHAFVKLDCGMTEVLRPSLYGAQHPVHVLRDEVYPAASAAALTSALVNADEKSQRRRAFVVVGHCCESGDLLTCAPGAPETVAERELPADVRAGDLVLVGGVGAYCSSMSAKNYNSYPEAAEVLLLEDGATARLIRRRQTLEQITQNEC
jgi:diaminopimelate decarboxylase